jgi:hypothetical protein
MVQRKWGHSWARQIGKHNLPKAVCQTAKEAHPSSRAMHNGYGKLLKDKLLCEMLKPADCLQKYEYGLKNKMFLPESLPQWTCRTRQLDQ